MAEDNTPLAPVCACPGCAQRELVSRAAISTAQLTTFFTPKADPPCTVMVSLDGKLRVVCKGQDEHEALFNAIEELRASGALQ